MLQVESENVSSPENWKFIFTLRKEWGDQQKKEYEYPKESHKIYFQRENTSVTEFTI